MESEASEVQVLRACVLFDLYIVGEVGLVQGKDEECKRQNTSIFLQTVQNGGISHAKNIV